ncbi:MAG: hypothetical protein JNM03_10595 [Sphingopyxis sp.]|uniref:hypothetical protein n=1 Tax=Sphingopyxis sp. TaxID=1908224 RepID=UPI001A36BB8D|nr:hypothetical protein [Sphingopyxis sp.]MBL9070426.1 hypothetical protein [Sphingopyxis sp.]
MTKIVGFREIFDAVVDDELTGERFALAFAGRRGAWEFFVSWLDNMMRIGAQKDAQQARVDEIIARDKADRIAEADRQAAILEIDDRTYVNVGDAVVPPTPEWLSKGDVITVTVQADGEGHHVRSVRTARRVVTSHAKRAYRAGKITDEQKVACEWYRDQYDAAGLEGRVKTANLAQRVSGGLPGGIMFTEDQVAAQWHFRNARERMDASMLKFFDLVMIDEIPVDRACRVARCGRHPYVTLRQCADAISGYMDEVGIEK